ncbi:hypothetical protein [Ruania albidiflava]|uniref:hypothetical protein n=1 Tax=Ruania albidiflava TaxID=366586 RepID=UPI0003B5AD9C|nr:hypothetical protein [Ruania albidiflava]
MPSASSSTATWPHEVVAAHRPKRFALFGEVLSVALVTLLLWLPVVTVLPALAAGTAHLRRYLEGRADPVRQVLTDFVASCRGVWGYGIALPAIAFLLVLNVDIATYTELPGGSVLRLLSVLVGAAVAVVALRAAGRHAAARQSGRHTTWTDSLRAAVDLSRKDPAGSALLVAALVVCAVIVWMLTALAILVPGLLALAILGVDYRYELRQTR